MSESTFTDNDRALMTEMNAKIAVLVSHMVEVRNSMYGTKADGLTYQVANIERDIKDVQRKMVPMSQKVRHHERVLFKNHVRRGVYVTLLAALVTVLTLVGTWISGILPAMLSNSVNNQSLVEVSHDSAIASKLSRPSK